MNFVKVFKAAFYRIILDGHFYVKFSKEEEFVCLLFFEEFCYVLLMADMSIIYFYHLIQWFVYFDLLATNFCNTMTNSAKN